MQLLERLTNRTLGIRVVDFLVGSRAVVFRWQAQLYAVFTQMAVAAGCFRPD